MFLSNGKLLRVTFACMHMYSMCSQNSCTFYNICYFLYICQIYISKALLRIQTLEPILWRSLRTLEGDGCQFSQEKMNFGSKILLKICRYLGGVNKLLAIRCALVNFSPWLEICSWLEFKGLKDGKLCS